MLIFEQKVNYSGTLNIILDRDGVLNADTGYAYQFCQFKLNYGLIEFLAKNSPYIRSLHIATNQSGIARGYFSLGQFSQNSRELFSYLKSKGVVVNSLCYCPHLPAENCECRKPRPGMLNEIINTFNLERSNTIFIGDRVSDRQCALDAGVHFLYLLFD